MAVALVIFAASTAVVGDRSGNTGPLHAGTTQSATATPAGRAADVEMYTVILGGRNPRHELSMLKQIPAGTPQQAIARAVFMIHSTKQMIGELAALHNPKVDAILGRYHVAIFDTAGRRVFPRAN
jgi:hypothetical protein